MLCVAGAPSSALLAPAAAASLSDVDGSAAAAAVPGLGLGGALGECGLFADFAPLAPKLPPLGGSALLPLVALLVVDCLLALVVSSARLLAGYVLLRRLAAAGGVWHFAAVHLHGAFILFHAALLSAGVGTLVVWHLPASRGRSPRCPPPPPSPRSSSSPASSAARWRRVAPPARGPRGLPRQAQPFMQPPMRGPAQLSLQRRRRRASTCRAPPIGRWTRRRRRTTPLSRRRRRPTAHLASTPAADDGAPARPRPVDVFLTLAGDGRRPLLVDELRPSETLGCRCTTLKEALFANAEMRRERELAPSTAREAASAHRGDAMRVGVGGGGGGGGTGRSGGSSRREGAAAAARCLPRRCRPRRRPGG